MQLNNAFVPAPPTWEPVGGQVTLKGNGHLKILSFICSNMQRFICTRNRKSRIESMVDNVHSVDAVVDAVAPGYRAR